MCVMRGQPRTLTNPQRTVCAWARLGASTCYRCCSLRLAVPRLES